MFAVKVTFFICLLASLTSEDLKEIKAKPGDDVTLQCWGTADAAIDLLEWSEVDLNPGYVFYFRDNLVYEDFQHEHYHGRVELRHPQMKNGDVSVIVKNISNSDAGTYNCRIIMGNTKTRGTQTERLEFTSNIVLKVENSGPTGEDTGGGPSKGGVPLVVFFFLSLAVVL